MMPKLFMDLPYATCGRAESSAEFMQKYAALKSAEPFNSPPIYPLIVFCAPGESQKVERCFQSLEIQSSKRWEIKKCDQQSLSDVLKGEISSAKAEWIALLNARAFLSPVALSRVASRLVREAGDFVCVNEVWLDDELSGSFISKRGYSPFAFKSWDCVGPFIIVRRSLLASLEQRGVLPADWNSLVGQLTESSRAWSVLPEFLLYVDKSDRVIVKEDWALSENLMSAVRPRVTAIICFKDRADWTVEALERLRLQEDIELEVIMVNNRSTLAEAARVKGALRGSSFVSHWFDFDEPFNFARMHNRAIERFASGEVLFFLNNDVFLRGTKTIAKMAAVALGNQIGTVGMRLEYPGGGLQHGGLEARFGGPGRMVRLGNCQADDFFSRIDREVMGNTFAACAVRNSLYKEIGGLREDDLINGFGDVAFNLECLRRKLRNIYLGRDSAIHFESGSRGRNYEYWEESIIERDYPELMNQILREDFGVNRIAIRGFQMKDGALNVLRWMAKRYFPWVYSLRQSYYWNRISREKTPAVKIAYKQTGPQPTLGLEQ